MMWHQHGTYARYQKAGGGCRCDACKAAARDYHRAYRRRKLDNWLNRTQGECVGGLGWPRVDPADRNLIRPLPRTDRWT